MSDATTRIALVTGAGSGIGEACAHALARAGMSLAVADLSPESAVRVSEDVHRAYGVRTLPVTVDVADAGSAQAMVDATVAEFGGLDAAVNNAGIGGSPAPVADLDLADWHRTLDVNLNGTFYCLAAEIRAMRSRGGGAIVNMGSIMSVVAAPNIAPYATSKHALIGLTRAAALDHAADGVRVNAVGPGFIRTPLFERTQGPAEQASLTALHPLGRLGEPADIAELVSFLLSEQARNITGAFFTSDGGYTAV